MFDEIKKYRNQDHFFYKKGDNLRELTKDIPDLPGIFYIFRLANGRIDLVFIEQSGTVLRNGDYSHSLLREAIHKDEKGVSRQQFFDKQFINYGIDALDIYWFVTMDDSHRDLPGYVKGLLMQRYYEIYGELPPWNTEF